MTAYDDFYGRVSRGFGATGGAYTIVPGRHIGTDFPAAGGTFVPALRAGTVVNVVKTSTMSWGVITDVGNGNYISYWHLSAVGLPSRGERLARGDRIGRVARGYVPYSHPEFAGTAWEGAHCHVVVGTHPASAYSMVNGHRTLWAFRDPTDFIVRGGASAGGSSLEEEDDMFTDEDRTRLNAVYSALFGPANVGAPELKWAEINGGAQKSRYGLLSLVLHNQTLADKVVGQTAPKK